MKYKICYCNGCHKLYFLTAELEECIIRIDKPCRVIPRICLECQKIRSQWQTELNTKESQIVHEAYRIIIKNDKKNEIAKSTRPPNENQTQNILFNNDKLGKRHNPP